MRRTKLWITAAAGLLVAGLMGAVAGAGGTFPDVGPTHPFVDEIEQFAGAGISAGYNDGTFRPGEPVTRQSMAAFMTRGLGQAAISEAGFTIQSGAPLSTTVVRDLEDVVVPGSASAGGTQYLWISANLTWSIPGTFDAACTNNTLVCAIRMDIFVDGTLENGAIDRITSDRDGGVMSAQSLVALPAGSTHDIELRFSPASNVANGAVDISDRQLAVMSVPFQLPSS